MLEGRGIGRVYDTLRFLPRLNFLCGICVMATSQQEYAYKRNEFISPPTMLVAIQGTKILHVIFECSFSIQVLRAAGLCD